MMRIVLILFASAFLLACEQKTAAKEQDIFYTCSMDPQVISDKPGNCPICGMKLTPVKKSAAKDTEDIELSDQQVQLGNIIVDTIKAHHIGNQVRLTGTLAVDQQKISTVSARIPGRIEKLYVKSVGDRVAKGAPLYEIYSEELNNAKQEYMLALQRRQLFDRQTVIDFNQLIQAARHKLTLWGMTEEQIKALAGQEKVPPNTTFYSTESGYVTAINVTEGSYLMEGGAIVTVANLSTLWAEAQVYASERYRIPERAAATIRIPGETTEIHSAIEFAVPEISDNRISIVRATIPNKDHRLRPGTAVYIGISTASRSALSIPTDAIIRDGNGATVWLQTGPNKFKSKMVQTGTESDGITEIMGGLQTGDVVVVRGTYLLHSEYIFKRGTDPMSGHVH